MVFVFTDGMSNYASDHPLFGNLAADETIEEARRLHEYATVFSIGIGQGTSNDELESIATDTNKALTLTDFSKVKPLMQSIINNDAVCGKFDCTNIFRTTNLDEMETRGASQVSGDGKSITCTVRAV